MMGPSHATSGAGTWLAGCAVVEAAGHPLSWQVIWIGAAVCAGWALAPDFDHPEATLAQSGGFVTKLVAKGIGGVSDVLHDHTRTRWDRPAEGNNSHRTFTHTLVYAFICYVVGAGTGRTGGPWAAAVLVFLAAALGSFSILPDGWRRIGVPTGFGRRKAYIPTAAFVAAPLAACAYFLTPDAAWWLGLATGGGCLVHCLGDMITHYGCPILWPIPIGPKGRKRTWYPLGPPKFMRFKAGGDVEKLIVTPILTVLMVGAAALVVYGPARVMADLLGWLAHAQALLLDLGR